MEVLKIGSRGDVVKSLQILLNNHGYIGNPDGIFGNNTESSVMDFQKKNFISSDGIVGRGTWNLLLNGSEKDEIKINDTKYVLTTKNYYFVSALKGSVIFWTFANTDIYI